MGRNKLKPVIFVLNEGYGQWCEANPDWVYNDLAPWNYHMLPAALGCRGWFTAKVTTLGELDAALARAATGESASYIEVVGGRMDFPAGLAKAHDAPRLVRQRLARHMHCRSALRYDENAKWLWSSNDDLCQRIQRRERFGPSVHAIKFFGLQCGG